MRAQADGSVDLKARAGFDGYCKKDQWLPIRVEVENTGPDLNAEIQVGYQKNAGGTSITSTKVELPATSRKGFFLYVYFPASEYNPQRSVSLLTNGKVLKKVNLSTNCLAIESTIFGVLADSPSTYDVLNDVKPLQGFVRVAQLKTSDLPDRAQAWASLDGLIVSNVDTGTLTPEQQRALLSWVASGGKLLIIGGTNWQSTVAGLQDLLPVDLKATRQVASLAQLQQYVKDPTPLDSEAILATGQVRKEAQVLVYQDQIPLIVQKPLGFGVVYFFAADPGLQPLSSWPGMKEVYEHLLGSKSPIPTWADGTWYDYRANQALATIPELGLPSIFYVCGLLGLYIVIIGPLNYFVLRRIKRRELAWATIPVLVIIFTCLAYATGFSYRGITPILNRLAVAQAWQGVDRAQVRALVGIYSPIRTKYGLQASDGFMFKPFNDNMNLQAGDSWTTLQEGSNMIVPEVSVEIGAMKAVVVEGSLPALELDHDLVIELSRLNPMLSGKITNKSQYTLQDAILVTPGNWARLGDIAPGQTKPVQRVSLASGPNGPAFYDLNSMSILDLDYSDIQTDVIAARRSTLLDTVLFTDYGWNDGNWGIYLMGWVDQIELPAGLKDQKFKSIDTMLYIDRLSPSIKAEPGQLRLPASLFTWESSSPTTSPYYAREVPPNGYTLRFQPAFPISSETVKSIELDLVTSASLQDLVASAWDYELEQWVTIPLNGNHTSIPDANRYVGPDGEIRIKIVSRRSDWTEISASNLTVVVEP